MAFNAVFYFIIAICVYLYIVYILMQVNFLGILLVCFFEEETRIFGVDAKALIAELTVLQESLPLTKAVGKDISSIEKQSSILITMSDCVCFRVPTLSVLTTQF